MWIRIDTITTVTLRALVTLAALLTSLAVSASEAGGSPNFNPVLQAALAHDRAALQQHASNSQSLDLHDSKGRSLVLRVTMVNDMEALKLLIGLGADVDYYNPQLSAGVIDQTAFLYAGAKGMNPALEILIAADARTDLVNYYGGNALIPAAEKGHLETVRLLLEQSSVDINLINNLGWTALMEAVLLSTPGKIQQQIVAVLLEQGADASIPDNEGISALEHAQNKGYDEIVRLLQQAISP